MPAGGYTPMFERMRLSTLAAFDRILVVQQDRIVAEGSAGELRRRGRRFEKMWRLHADGLVVR
jgi:ATP-binding cassette subfamily B protein